MTRAKRNPVGEEPKNKRVPIADARNKLTVAQDDPNVRRRWVNDVKAGDRLKTFEDAGYAFVTEKVDVGDPIAGEASTDMFSGQVGPRLAGILNIPQITYAQKIDAEIEKNHSIW